MLRQDRIGDVLVSLPIVHALKRHFPSAQIDALFGENNHFIAANDPVFNERFIYKKNLSGATRILRTLRHRHYDYLIDFMDNVSTSSTIFVSRIKAHCSIGIEKENAYIYDVVVPRLPQSSVHIVDRLGELLRPFGITPEYEDLRLSYPLPAAAIVRAEEWFSPANNGNRAIERPVRIGVNVSASGVDKDWGKENFSAMLTQLQEIFPQAKFVLFCAPGDEARAQEIASATRTRVFPPSTFDEFAAGIHALDALITVDTSAVHLAAAYQIPAVVLYVHDKPELMPWIPYKSPHRAVTTQQHTVRSISVKEVVDSVVDLDREFHCCSRPHYIPA
jgi:ADP-heptose:LPS heptosyltransferase